MALALLPEITISSMEASDKIRQRVMADENKNYVCILVKDNSIGFEQEYNHTIFGLFQRLNGRYTTAQE